MTTGQDENGRRGRGADLLASLPGGRPGPGIDPAAFEELRTAVLEIREQVAGLRTGAQAELLTPDGLAAWEEGFLERLGGMLSGRMEAAAERIGKAGEGLIAEVGEMEERRAGERTELREAVSGVEKTLSRIDANFNASQQRALRYLDGIRSGLGNVEKALGRLQLGWWIVLALCVFLTGMVVESRVHLLHDLLSDI